MDSERLIVACPASASQPISTSTFPTKTATQTNTTANSSSDNSFSAASSAETAYTAAINSQGKVTVCRGTSGDVDWKAGSHNYDCHNLELASNWPPKILFQSVQKGAPQDTGGYLHVFGVSGNQLTYARCNANLQNCAVDNNSVDPKLGGLGVSGPVPLPLLVKDGLQGSAYTIYLFGINGYGAFNGNHLMALKRQTLTPTETNLPNNIDTTTSLNRNDHRWDRAYLYDSLDPISQQLCGGGENFFLGGVSTETESGVRIDLFANGGSLLRHFWLPDATPENAKSGWHCIAASAKPTAGGVTIASPWGDHLLDIFNEADFLTFWKGSLTNFPFPLYSLSFQENALPHNNGEKFLLPLSPPAIAGYRDGRNGYVQDGTQGVVHIFFNSGGMQGSDTSTLCGLNQQDRILHYQIVRDPGTGYYEGTPVCGDRNPSNVSLIEQAQPGVAIDRYGNVNLFAPILNTHGTQLARFHGSAGYTSTYSCSNLEEEEVMTPLRSPYSTPAVIIAPIPWGG